ncbi:Bug family tripartite tricarboxylate transporter substrate binding protein [Belnapia rosea]|uniref:Tripartite-type tricarboxylate transporter, receptor component TctC n=1 Tax=Belnapia rosea TaxID=938405 RepID=A0A1G7CY74_9PROT|nr:tripartite tricarboxylate transporter substrate-binding protein [Belnapia rosea]SDE43435.1 Tripartite-type tricarboxylate transporter, receptor component TctC [Belnapia rosea]
MSGIGRRTFLAAALGAPAAARAQEAAWPARPVTLVTGYPAGALTDTATRAAAERLARELGQPVVVENRTGAAAAIAAAHVVRARPDGYTLLMGAASLAIAPALQPQLVPQDPLRELAPIAHFYDTPFILVVHPDVPAADFAGFLDLARRTPGGLTFGSSGIGAPFVHVPYRGAAPALVDLTAGRLPAFLATVSDAAPLLADRRARAIAVTARERIALMPDLPAMQETLPGVQASFWQALFAPAGTPQPIVARLAAAMRAATGDPAFRAQWEPCGLVMGQGGPEELRALLAADLATWGRLIRESGIRVE